jgi:pilus assembly protein CpaB
MYRRALLVAFVFAVVAVTLFILYVKRFEQESSGGERVRVLVALRPIERGKMVTDDALTVREVPQAYVEDRAVREVDKAKVVGLRVGGLLQAQQTLMWTDLAVASEERRDLSALVQPGRRAVTAHFRSDVPGSLVRPGDYVDVISVATRGGSGDKRVATVLLQRVLVLAVGSSTLAETAFDSKSTDGRQGDLTLSVTLPEAQLLAVASENDSLVFALRSAEDSQTAARVPEVALAAAGAEPQAPEDPRAARRGPTEVRNRSDLRP